MVKQANKNNRKQNDISSAKSSRVRAKAPSTTIIRKQKSSSPFSKTPKVSASSKVKVKSSPLKVSQKSKSIKKVAAKKTVKKSNDNKTKKIVALKNKIDQMNKKIKLAEKPRMTRSTKSGNVDKADSRDNLTKKVSTKCQCRCFSAS